MDVDWRQPSPSLKEIQIKLTKIKTTDHNFTANNQTQEQLTISINWQMKPQYYSYRNRETKLEKLFWKLPVENTPFLDCVSLTSTPSWVYHCPSFLSYLTGSGVGVWGVNVNRSVSWKVEQINNPLNSKHNKLRHAHNITAISLWDFSVKK